MKVYVGNLPWSAEDQDLNDAFGEFGEVTSAKIITDRDTGRSRGFGFVSMSNDDEARQAIESLNDSEFQGRNMNCREATPRQERPRHGGGGGGGGGGRGDRGGFHRGGGGRDRDRDRRY